MPSLPPPLPAALTEIAIVEAERVLVVPDLHLRATGAGLRPGLETVLAAAVRRGAEAGVVVLAGDQLEVGPGETVASVLARYPILTAAFRACAAENRLYYVLGNHDPGKGELAVALGCPIVTAVQLFSTTYVVHGTDFDEYLRSASGAALQQVHTWSERLLASPIRFPFRSAPNFLNRAYQCVASLVFASLIRIGATFGRPAWSESVRGLVTYLLHQELEVDPHYLIRNLAAARLPEGTKRVVCGHSHLPGLAWPRAGLLYVNAGVWDDRRATLAWLTATDTRVEDAVTGAVHGFETYTDWARDLDWLAWWEHQATHIWPRAVLKAFLAQINPRRSPQGA